MTGSSSWAFAGCVDVVYLLLLHRMCIWMSPTAQVRLRGANSYPDPRSVKGLETDQHHVLEC